MIVISLISTHGMGRDEKTQPNILIVITLYIYIVLKKVEHNTNARSAE